MISDLFKASSMKNKGNKSHWEAVTNSNASIPMPQSQSSSSRENDVSIPLSVQPVSSNVMDVFTHNLFSSPPMNIHLAIKLDDCNYVIWKD